MRDFGSKLAIVCAEVDLEASTSGFEKVAKSEKNGQLGHHIFHKPTADKQKKPLGKRL